MSIEFVAGVSKGVMEMYEAVAKEIPGVNTGDPILLVSVKETAVASEPFMYRLYDKGKKVKAEIPIPKTNPQTVVVDSLKDQIKVKLTDVSDDEAHVLAILGVATAAEATTVVFAFQALQN